MERTAQDRFMIERAYRDVFGPCKPSMTDFPKAAIYPLGMNALMRGSPVTEEELKDWIEKNSPPAKP